MNPNLSRRNLLKTSALAGVAAGFPAIVPSSVLGASAPSNTITIAGIGTGSMGMGNLKGLLNQPDTRLLAVCDVDSRHRANGKRTIDAKYGNSDCAEYSDYRELLARDDIDAVFHALPDHWHGIICVAAANAGKDIYGQKPLARTIPEGRAIVEAVERNGVIWQTGSQQRSDGRFRMACELVRNGRLGKIKFAEARLPGGYGGGSAKTVPVPKELDYEMWLGPAPMQPHRDLGRGGSMHWNWRWLRDFSGGQITDWAGHNIDISHWALGLDETGPVEISGTGGFADSDLFNVITSFDFDLKYADGSLIKVTSKYGPGVRFVGEEGEILVTREKIEASDPSMLKDPIPSNGIRLYESRDHHRNFIDCVKSRRPCICPAETGHRSISAGLLGELAIYTGRTLKWDPEHEIITNDPVANGMLTRAFREPWVL
ncbi:Gfo/Idh/MocA family oxidoreductase [Pontiella agarivorans]|uniref:Gfo/Idh/MocA family oxidoreductase n=1 Tax=Pontiella agarivorans TaxID=3038953 RepID=A0ABU5MWP4_9BACT|nr:Gfo/Idh/MocA family oxidoreductase [Pontiella agarivorans]MDZ8118605.1 Gfo/Idh/MocA family oxidoreductase [Pontiella agarivorans]